MPIEIKELHIKINVDEKATATTNATSVDEAKLMRAVSESVEQIVNIEQRKKKIMEEQEKLQYKLIRITAMVKKRVLFLQPLLIQQGFL
ncbi:hypothetical protein EJ377_17220 [Chryseobacterium arthrosphaerae]|uniref:Uncharacterized protein n=1 Tax=Chryseobacterium arthrosphaerae TaxID=651561 RepID=A0A432DSS0_9FLAO|nr:hypothetical protein EJ377_17220 [Chryseobacterium arthrosphaerae]